MLTPISRSMKRAIPVVVAAALAFSACGSDETDSSEAADTTAVATESTSEDSMVDDTVADTMTDDSMTDDSMSDDSMSDDSMVDDGASTSTESAAASADGEASAIVSISPTATEMLYAIGAGDQVVAVDTFSDYPAEAVDKQTGIEAFSPNVEEIAALNPDLVVSDGTNPDFLAQLDELQIAHWEGPAAASFDDIYTQIEQLGAATGHVGEAAELVGQMQSDIDAVVEEAPAADGVSYYHELDNTFFSITSTTFAGQVYGLFGMTNIADEAEGADSGYPQLSPEYIIEANPTVIYLACGEFCEDTPATVEARPGWDQIAAVQNGNVIELDPDVASRWGPRVVDFAQTIADSIAQVEAPVGN